MKTFSLLISTWMVVSCTLPMVSADAPDETAHRTRIGNPIKDVTFKDIRYVTRSIQDLGQKKAYVFVFSNTTCPLVQKYWPKLKRLDEQFRPRGVQFVGVNVGIDDEVQDVAQQGIDFAVSFPLVKDVDGNCVRALGVSRTPEVAVLDAELRLRYRGRIDDQFRIGGARPNVTADNLNEVLDALLAGKDVATSETIVEGCRITLPSPPKPNDALTFHEHISPLMQKHCQDCHRPRGEAPFSLVTYDEVASQAAMIAEVVGERRMPPWFAHRQQKFANERGLTPEERSLVSAWVAGGRPAGDAAKGPEPRVFHDSKWEIGEPDLVTTAFETQTLPADGFVDYKYVVLPFVFLQDTWISAAEILPSNPRVVHHCNMAYWTIGKSFDQGNFITGRVPGGTAMVLDDGIGFKIPSGSVVGLQIHYTTTGKEEKNQMSVGFRFPRDIVRKQLHHVQVTTSRFEIPPEASSHLVSSTRTLPCNASGIGMFSHMHLRGKDMTFLAKRPDDSEEKLLSIPNYHYGWQQNYRWEPGTKKFPKGTQIHVDAHFDNSAFNPFNPDSSVAVRPGPQTIHEMMFGFFFYTDDDEELGLRIDPKSGHVMPPAEPKGDTVETKQNR